MPQITTLQPVSRYDGIDFLVDWEDSLVAAHLTHYASRLLDKGLHDPGELEQALHKAIIACRAAGLPVTDNFKTIFICSGGCDTVTTDWLVSDLGLQLILLNADVSNPLVARLQVQVLAGFENFKHQ
jgi:hypothetical protein